MKEPESYERLIRLREVVHITGMSRSSVYLHIKEGVFPHPIALGVRMVGWRESEVVAINAARVRGLSDDDLRALVARLESSRKSAA